jgi:hypothetical protein
VRDHKIDEKERIAVHMVWEHHRPDFPFHKSSRKDTGIGRNYFMIAWSWSGGCEMGEKDFDAHGEGTAELFFYAD